jgi:hypothetical protein
MTITSYPTNFTLSILKAFEEYFNGRCIVGHLHSKKGFNFKVQKGVIEQKQHQELKFREL